MKSSLRRIFFFVIVPAILLAFLYVFTSTIVDDRAEATNNAFQYTKHGGGTVDGMPFSGVDRGVNPDYIFYNDAYEAGQYAAGECTMCHEPHASFGGVEPEPSAGSFQDSDGGPNPYLGLAGADQNFCWYCHENINFDPAYWGGTGFWKFYQGQAVYEASSHFISNNVKSPGYGSGQPWPRTDRTSNILSGHCLNCHTPHGIMETPGSEYDTTAVPTSPSNMHLASNNASVSQDYLIPRQLIAWEEALCENCHDADGPALSDIQTEINKRGSYTGTGTTDGSGGSGHLVDYTTIAGRHTAEESTVITKTSTAGDLKHVECYDCHNPHAATGSGSGGTSEPGSTDFNRLAGMNFVRCDSTDCSGVEASPASLGRDPYVHEVCMRCHGDGWSDFFDASNIYPSATTFRPPGLSNKRLEFNPSGTDATYGPNQTYNSAYHPIAAPGNNTSLAMCLSLQAAFGLSCSSASGAATELSGLTINCTDCHNTEATSGVSGPVTESSLRMTDKASNYVGGSVVGPHASQITIPASVTGDFDGATDNQDRSLLRDFYFTGNIPTNDKPFFSPSNSSDFRDRFKLCFNCHDWNTFYGNNDNTGFYRSGGMGPNNLHSYHLRGVGGGMMWNSTYEACMTCHYNIHSNVQATNTDYAGGGSLPPDGDTHLVNYAPGVVTGRSYSKPAWFYSGGSMYCNLYCHGVAMDYSYNCTNSVTNGTSDTCND